jgi:phage terminase large subunit
LEITLPAFGWKPRPYQFNAWDALQSGKKRLALAWHRRSGKDELALHWTAVSSVERIGPYWHMLPMASQARKAIWDAVNPHTGRRRIDEAFPLAMRASTRDQDMFIRFVNGSTWQVVGSDNYNALVGSPPVGIVFSEYALADPSAWALLRPILAENKGWALFISTTRGRNHFQRLVEYARANPTDWYGETLTVEDTKAIPMEVIDQERRELTAERGPSEAKAIIAQEYYCDADASIPGAYYGELMGRAEAEVAR